MNEDIIARRYAQGLVEVAAERKELAEVGSDLAALADVLDPARGEISVPELLDSLLTPTIPVAQKVKVTDVLCDKLKIGKTVSDFLNVLIEKGRVDLASAITNEYDRLSANFSATMTAQIETAKPLTTQQEKELQILLTEKTKRTVSLKVKTNPSLIGGLRVQMGDLVLDGSIENRLQRLETRLK